MQRTILLWVMCMWVMASAAQETSSVTLPPHDQVQAESDSFFFADTLQYDSMHQRVVRRRTFGLLDTVSNDTILISIFKPYVNIRSPFFERSFSKARRNMPTVKEIHERPQARQQWKFWVVVFILLYIAFVRISNPNGFKAFIISVFNLKLSEKIWEDQKSYFGFIYLQLFAIYIFIAALFLSYLTELKKLSYFDAPFLQFLAIVLVLIAVYLLKFLLHSLLGQLLRMKNLGVGFISNTISVNNFIALVIFPFLIFLLYNNYDMLRLILVQTIIATFFISVAYRVVRIALLSNSFFSFPIIYLFIYLCALEILPWFVIVKFLDQFQI